ncbi:MAG: methyltransferase domain-containing protein [Candidatus Hydrogenedentota bacterium]
MNDLTRTACTMALLLTCILVFQTSAQKTSVAPGINDNFQNPDVDRYVKMFEGESRSIFTHRHAIVKTLGLEPGMAVGDIGAGTGFFSLLFSDEVGKKGKVYAVDIAQNFIDHIKTISQENKKKNIKGIVCDEHSVKLPKNSIDVAFICDVYHHFEYPFDSLKSIHAALKPGGTMVIVDFRRIEGRSREWTLDHVRCGIGDVIDEAQQSGFDFVEKIDLGMPDQYVIKFVKTETTSNE